MNKQWVTWNISTGYLTVEGASGATCFDFTVGAVRSIGHAVEVLGDAGYVVVTAWLASGMSDVHMVCMVERAEPDEEPEPLPNAFCDVYDVHEPHVYRALNRETYRCIGLTAEDLAEIDQRASDLCEHGMSAALCGGPMHWYN